MTIKDRIYTVLKDSNKQWIPQNHNPSSASFKYPDGRIVGKDLLSLYYKWKGVPPSNPFSVESLLKFRLGDGAHEVLAKILSKAGIKHISEVAGKAQLPGLQKTISYRVDGLMEIDGNVEVLEVKSTDENQLLGRGWGIKDKGPKLEHIIQVLCYTNLVAGVKQARLLYIARDTGDMLEYIVGKEYEGVTFSGIVDRWRELERHLENNTVPLPEFKVWLNEDGEIMPVKQIKGQRYKSDWQAMYGDYKDMIYKDPKNYDLVTYNAEFKKKGIL
jgi:hypothetical protein